LTCRRWNSTSTIQRTAFFTFLNLSYESICHAENGDVFENFANHIGNGNPLIRQQLLELVALAITGYEVKCFYVLLGESNTGKTQFGRFLEELIGRENVESIAGVHDFSNRFTTAALAGKKLGTCLDLPDAPLPSIAIGTIKQFVGDDSVKIERKYKDSQTLYHKPLLLFAGNHPIRLPNAAHEQALLNRMIAIPFANPVQPEHQRQQLYKNLLNEAPYIVSQAILAYRNLLSHNFNLTKVNLPPEFDSQDSRQSYRDVKSFLESFCIPRHDESCTTEELFQTFWNAAETEGYTQLSEIAFGRMLGDCF